MDKVRQLYKLRLRQERFIPGESIIKYAGRVCDYQETKNLIESALDSWFTLGRYAREFENNFAKFIGRKFCILTNSGSSANLLAVSALTSSLLKERRLKPQDEIITTACGFPTTLNPILQNNLIPVFVDVNLGTYNIQVESIKRAISKRTKAIFIAHTLGNPAELGEIVKIASKYKLWFIEDNCDALGAKYGQRNTGTFGHISTSSFYPAHHITMGEGGALLTDDSLLKRIICSYRDWGRDCWCEPGCDNTCGRRFSWELGELPRGYDHKYIYTHIGYNLKATDMQAAIGVAQLKKLPGFIEMRRRNFNFLDNYFKKFKKYFVLPIQEDKSKPSWFGYPLLVKNNAPFCRDDIVNYLERCRIVTRMLFAGNLTMHPAYREARYRIYGSLKNSDLVMKNLFWIGVYPGITYEHLSYIADTLDRFLEDF